MGGWGERKALPTSDRADGEKSGSRSLSLPLALVGGLPLAGSPAPFGLASPLLTSAAAQAARREEHSNRQPRQPPLGRARHAAYRNETRMPVKECVGPVSRVRVDSIRTAGSRSRRKEKRESRRQKLEMGCAERAVRGGLGGKLGSGRPGAAALAPVPGHGQLPSLDRQGSSGSPLPSLVTVYRTSPDLPPEKEQND